MAQNQVEHTLEQERHVNEENYRENWRAQRLDEVEFYTQFARPLRQGGNNHRYPGMKALFDDLLGQSDGPFLDCACGAGEMAIWLALHGKQVWAFDLSKNAIEIAQRSAELSGVADSITFDVMDAKHLDYKDGFFGAITGKDCLHHLIKYPGAVEELARVLKPGGMACFYEPLAFNPLINLLRRINISLRGYIGEHMLTRHDIQRLKRIFGDAHLSHHTVLSVWTRFIANTHEPLSGLRRRICMALIDLDRSAQARLPSLGRFSACAYLQLAKRSSCEKEE